jgi:hypothetical protein
LLPEQEFHLLPEQKFHLLLEQKFHLLPNKRVSSRTRVSQVAGTRFIGGSTRLAAAMC